MECPHGHEDEIFAKWDERDVPCKTCGEPTQRVWKSAPKVHGDECDYIDENLGPEPIRIRSKSQRKQLMKERGLVECVRHVGTREGDRSEHTTRWI